ncbi:MAG: 16S rRNA (cytosine(1402)-N(4))-methyltransferase RsmH [Chloroflexi bacterium]|nr:16S rRNA (cytosine(1402)-N(4))-methyltransferase RsmH [Chloroflexota bacterium]
MNASLGDNDPPHRPVLYHEIIHALRPISTGVYVDATVGAGGHAAGILSASVPHGRLLGLDIDPLAIKLANRRLSQYGERVSLMHASYVTLHQQIESLGWEEVDGIMLDLGASSMQFDHPGRGFSFQAAGPLDMRFDTTAKVKAADLVNELPQDELASLISHYGEERHSKKAAKAIVEARPLSTTLELAEVLEQTIKAKRGGIHPATRTFQALRIAVNGELEALETVLPESVKVLASGGRLAVIAFHSLEDRIVKRFFRQESNSYTRQPDDAPSTPERKATIKEITRRPIKASMEEINQNPRARSARLRVAEKI